MRSTTLDKELNRSKIDYKETARRSRKEKRKNNSKIIKIKIFFIICFILGTLACFGGLFLLYSPYAGFRDWLITTAMSTMTHQYLATWFYDEETINDCLARNSIEDTSASTDTDLINIVDYSDEDIEYENEYEEAVLKKSAKNNDYKIIEIEGDKYSGYLAVIYDPSRVSVVASDYLGTNGQYLTTISENSGSYVAINAGGFVDEAGGGTGGIPVGITISNGEYLWTDTYTGQGGLIGLNSENKLVLGKYSVSQAKSLGIRDGVTFGPFLVVNGEPVAMSGNGGWGTGPRTAIAQRQDGIILFLVLDGNRTLGQGATLKDVQEILVNYGAYNAANLDGGTSTSMTVHSSLINDPTTQSGSHRTRPVATAFILEADESDDGDYSVVADKVED